MSEKHQSNEPAELPEGYSAWLLDLKSQIHTAQQRAALAVNRELIRLYWQIGREILDRQIAQGWGARVIDRLAHDLRSSFPDMKGLSPRNLKYMRAFAGAWPESDFVQQPVAQLPWGHNIVLLTKLQQTSDRLAYAHAALTHGWSRSVLVHLIGARRLERSGKAVTNFDTVLPAEQSDLAREALKDPYKLDFLGLGRDAHEREIESALVEHVTEFLLELGAGFAFVGRQVHLQVGEEDFFLDLLFYHLRLRCYVVIELKASRFKPEHAGQLGFYMTAVDAQVKNDADGPTIGLLLCKGRDEVVAEYALRDTSRPLGVSEYQLIDSLPDDLQTALPTVEQIERELVRGRD